mgnify:FL=1
MLFADPVLDTDHPVATAVFAAIGFLVGLAIMAMMLRLVGRYFLTAATGRDIPATLSLMLALLTLVLIVGAFLTGDDNAWTLAATGIGALAASLTSMFNTPSAPPIPESTSEGEAPDV